MGEVARLRDLRVRVDPSLLDAMTDSAVRDRVLAALPADLDRPTAEATAADVVAAVRAARRRTP